jgi:hypothetical protein
MLTVSEIATQIERGEIAWPGELRGDGLLLRLGSPLQLLADPGHVIDLAKQDSMARSIRRRFTAGTNSSWLRAEWHYVLSGSLSGWGRLSPQLSPACRIWHASA